MIPEQFDYSAPATLRDALALVASGERKLLAGGMTLIPMMKLRLATPAEVVDLGRVPGLAGIAQSDGLVRVGAMATHHAVETSPITRAHCPLLAETAGHIGDMQVRNMGTLGGSIAHADPAADYPAALLALDARIHLVSAASDRMLAATDFFVDAFTTALDPGEMVLEIQLPAQDVTEGYKYEKARHPASGFAVVGVAARVLRSAGRVTMARIGVTGLAAYAFRARHAEQVLESGGSAAQAAALVGEGVQANTDLYAAADYRMHLAHAYARRAIAAALARAA